jgi:hypothetical protein
VPYCTECGAPLAREGDTCRACEVARRGAHAVWLEEHRRAAAEAEGRCDRCGARLPGPGEPCGACAIRDRLAERDRLEAERRRALAEADAERWRPATGAEREAAGATHVHDTGLGRCPNCRSPNVVHVRKDETNTSAQAAFASCMCCCIA